MFRLWLANLGLGTLVGLNYLVHLPEVRSLQSVSGPYDLVALGVVTDVHQMDLLTDRIGAVDGVERTSSAIVLSTKFER